MPTVSIVLPTYNGSRYIRESIESCLNQTHEDLELIVVDDCSTDETPQIVAGYDDPRVRVIRHDRNRKLPAALNTGFAACRGRFLTWTSDDNRYAPDAIEVMVQALETRPGVGLVYAGCRLIDSAGEVIRVAPAEPPERLPFKCTISGCFLYRCSVYEQIGDYDESLFRIEDYDYWLRVAHHFRIAALPHTLYDYRVHAGSLTSQESLAARARAYDALLTKFFGPDPQRFRRCLGDMQMARAFESYQARDWGRVAPNVLRGLWREPAFLWNRGVWAIFVRSVLRSGPRLAGTAAT